MSSWTGQRVLVTGAGGFIGSHLVDRLVTLGADVTAFLRYNSDLSIGALRHSSKETRENVKLLWGDIRDIDSITSACRHQETVFHLAALISIPYSYVAPRQYLETNAGGTLNVLEAVRTAKVTRLVHTSTSEVYGTPLTVPITEEHQLRAQSPYAASKIAADKLAESFFCAFDVSVATIRPFNTYGPRQSPRAVVPTIVSQALAGNEIALGSLEPRRDLNFVSDVVNGFLTVGERPEAIGRATNVGSGHAHSIADVVQRVGRLLGRELVVVVDPERVRPVASEIELLISDSSKASELGWRPSADLTQGLQLTIDWFANHPLLSASNHSI